MTNDIFPNFFLKIKMLRVAENITQQELSKKWGIPKQTVQAYESGRRFPKGEALIRLCQAFPEYTCWLMNGQTNADAGQISPEIKLMQKEGVNKFEAKSV